MHLLISRDMISQGSEIIPFTHHPYSNIYIYVCVCGCVCVCVLGGGGGLAL